MERYLERDQIIKTIIGENGKIVVLGSGKLAQNFMQNTSLHIEKYIFDSDETKWGIDQIKEYIIVDPSDRFVNCKDVYILIASSCETEIANEINRIGYSKWISLPLINSTLNFYESANNPDIKACLIETSSLCNAKCKFCSNPTLKRKKQNMSMEVFEKIIFRLKEINAKPDIFRMHLLGELL